MAQAKLKINRPHLHETWTPEQMRAAVVRIHNRFQGLVQSVIESADFANYRITKQPLELGRPAWPDPAEYCDLVLARRSGASVAAIEVKTRHVKYGEQRQSGEILESVLDHMGSKLHQLQRLAYEHDALWVVILGLYRVPFQAAAINYRTEFEVVMIWGRDVGRDSPMSRASFPSLDMFDRAICSCVDPVDFWSLASLPRLPLPNRDTTELEELVAHSKLKQKAKRALLAIIQWPEESMPLRTYLREFSSEDCSEYALKHYVLNFIDAGVVVGYKKGKRAHRLAIDEQRLLAYLIEVDRE